MRRSSLAKSPSIAAISRTSPQAKVRRLPTGVSALQASRRCSDASPICSKSLDACRSNGTGAGLDEPIVGAFSISLRCAFYGHQCFDIFPAIAMSTARKAAGFQLPVACVSTDCVDRDVEEFGDLADVQERSSMYCCGHGALPPWRHRAALRFSPEKESESGTPLLRVDYRLANIIPLLLDVCNVCSALT